MTRHIHPAITTRRMLTLCAAALALAFTVNLHAAVGQTNRITVHKAVALPGVVLTPGNYVFQLLQTGSGHVVRVASPDGTARYLGLTIPVTRHPDEKGPTIVFGEAPAGEPQPIISWFPDGLNQGEQFLYR